MQTSNNKQRGFAALELILVLVAVVVIAGVGYYVYQRNNDSGTKASVATEQAADITTLPESLDGLKTIKEIQPLAEKDANGQAIVSVDLEQEHGKPVFMFKLANGRVLVYDAKTGGALTDRKTTVGNDEARLPDGFVPTITLEQAMEKAQAQLPNKSVTKIQLQNEERVVVYSVRFEQGGRVDVNAKTGELVKVLKGSDSGSSKGQSSQHQPTDQNDDSSQSSGTNTGDRHGNQSQVKDGDDSNSGSDDSSSSSTNDNSGGSLQPSVDDDGGSHHRGGSDD